MNFHRKGVYSYYLGTGIHVGLDFGCFQIVIKFVKIWKLLWPPAPKTVGDTLHVKKKVAFAFFWLAPSAKYQTVANLFDFATTFKS